MSDENWNEPLPVKFIGGPMHMKSMVLQAPFRVWKVSVLPRFPATFDPEWSAGELVTRELHYRRTDRIDHAGRRLYVWGTDE